MGKNISYYAALQQWEVAKQDVNLGYKKEAIATMESLQHKLYKTYGFNYSLAKAYYLVGNTTAAIAKLEYAHQYECNQKHHETLGIWFNELGDSTNAIVHLKLSLYITPQLLQSRLYLMDFYKEHNDIINAKYWAQQIIDCPIKINNIKSIQIKQKAQTYLDAF